MKSVYGSNVKVSTDNTGGFVSVDWDCPYCGSYNAGFYFSDNYAVMQGDFEIDHECSDCGKKVTIICKNATSLFD